MLPGGDIPQSDGVVVTPTCQDLAIRTERDTLNPIRVPREGIGVDVLGGGIICWKLRLRTTKTDVEVRVRRGIPAAIDGEYV